MTHPTIISASILAADFAHLGEAVAQAEAGGADWIHIDVMDGHFVPQLTMGPLIVAAVRRTTSLPIDVHLMVTNPEAMTPAFVDAGADSLTVHVEAVPQLHRAIGRIHDLGARAGVALNPGTPPEAVAEVLGLADLVMVMTVDPGLSGQPLIEATLDKVRRTRGLLDAANARARLQVDGGITRETAPIAARNGADTFVAAKAIFGAPGGVAAGIQILRTSLEAAHA
jgi:ribulose-phosphate 3-epimerase